MSDDEVRSLERAWRASRLLSDWLRYASACERAGDPVPATLVSAYSRLGRLREHLNRCHRRINDHRRLMNLEEVAMDSEREYRATPAWRLLNLRREEWERLRQKAAHRFYAQLSRGSRALQRLTHEDRDPVLLDSGLADPLDWSTLEAALLVRQRLRLRTNPDAAVTSIRGPVLSLSDHLRRIGLVPRHAHRDWIFPGDSRSTIVDEYVHEIDSGEISPGNLSHALEQLARAAFKRGRRLLGPTRDETSTRDPGSTETTPPD